MSNANKDKHASKEETRLPYEPPTIIYKGKISTRAGSPLSTTGQNTEPNSVDPADLFGNN